MTVAIVFALGYPTASLFARAPDESEFLASGILADDVANWILNLENIPRSIGVFSVYANEPFGQDYANIVETEVLKMLAKKGIEKVTTCSDCRSPQITVQDDRLVIRKGAPDLESLKKLGVREPVETFLTIEIYRTKLSVVAQAVLYKNPSGEVIAADRFRVSAINMMDSAVQILLEFGGGKPLGSAAGGTAPLMTSANLLLLEEVGFAKAGLNIGTLMGGDDGTLIHLNPTLAFYGKFGRSSLGWSLNLGAGFGLRGSTKGISLRAAYEIFLGSLAVMGPEFSYYLPQSGASNTGSGFFGLHIGIALGR